ncbi:MAG: DEAD/DEAH box helicase [Paludibacteraceae bacterium]|nr:DEAD/DEAH box helicase [Paludibacteraceae bacterium]
MNEQLDIFVHQPIEENTTVYIPAPKPKPHYVLRDYQREASDAAVNFFNGKLGKGNALIVCPTGSGKSLIVADIASRLDGKLLVFQPSKEILEQNYEKYRSYGFYDCAVWSASMNSKKRARVTFATIGSVMSNPEVFEEYKNIIVDECHLCNARGGRYKEFFEMGNRHILGLTATPYRLVSYSTGCILKFLTRTKPRIFAKLIYQVPIQKLMADGYLAKLRYFDMQLIDVSNVRKNSTGQDYDEESLRKAYKAQDMNRKLVEVVNRLRTPKDGSRRHGILVFTRFIEESEWLVSQLGDCAAIVTGETPKKERERILKDFKSGKLEVVANVGVLTTGFDYPELDTVVMARPTMSLALWYQCVGRGIRPSEGKNGWLVDMCGNVGRFGKVDDLTLTESSPGRGDWCVWGVVKNKWQQLTNIFF